MSLFGKRRDGDDAPEAGRREAHTSTAQTGAMQAPPAHPAPPAPAQPDRESRSAGSGTEGRTTGGKPSPTKGGAVATIGKSIVFKGELSGDEDLEVDGAVEGDIKLPNHVLKIGAHGKVKASVIAKCVQVVGHVAGNVSATERVEIEASGIVEGDIRAPRLLVQEGAVINGAIEMTKAAGAAGAAPPKPAAEPARKVG